MKYAVYCNLETISLNDKGFTKFLENYGSPVTNLNRRLWLVGDDNPFVYEMSNIVSDLINEGLTDDQCDICIIERGKVQYDLFGIIEDGKTPSS